MIDFLWWVAVKSWPDRVSDCLCLYVCPSIFESGEKTAGPIGTGETPFDTPEGGKTMVPIAERSVSTGTCRRVNPYTILLFGAALHTIGRK